MNTEEIKEKLDKILQNYWNYSKIDHTKLYIEEILKLFTLTTSRLKSYLIFSSPETFEIWQKENPNINILSITPIQGSLEIKYTSNDHCTTTTIPYILVVYELLT